MNSIASLDEASGPGVADDSLRSGLSTIQGSSPGGLLEDVDEQLDIGTGRTGPTSSGADMAPKKSTAEISVQVSDLSFIGADGKLYTPAKVEGTYDLQEIPPPPGSASAKSTKRRAASARKKAPSSRRQAKSAKPIKTGLGRSSKSSAASGKSPRKPPVESEGHGVRQTDLDEEYGGLGRSSTNGDRGGNTAGMPASKR